MATKIDTKTARDKLKPRREPYWHRVSKGAALGYRKMTADGNGTWIAQYRDEETGKQQPHPLGRFEEVLPSERFDAANKTAAEWFVHMGQGGSTGATTVRQACEAYVKQLRDDKREAAAKDADGRFKRWIYPGAKLASTPMQKLTKVQIATWRRKLASTLAIPQDKSKDATKERTRSALDRDVGAFRAALNLSVRNGECTSDGAWKQELKSIAGVSGRRDVYLDIGQRRALIAAAPSDLAAWLRGLSLLPLRPGALASLVAGNFDKRLRTLTIGKDKVGKDRKIRLPESTAAFFSSQSKDKLPAAPLFVRDDGKPWNKDSWKDPFKAAALAAKLPPATVAYSLRHSVITDLIALHHRPTLEVAQLSGTSLAMIEKHYGHLLNEQAADGLALLAL